VARGHRGLALTLCVLAFNIVGDAVRDALDPDYRE
jgi:ABC-type dipeptide/oligopeptide/nickel transport system permease subunit